MSELQIGEPRHCRGIIDAIGGVFPSAISDGSQVLKMR
jgi:hypothetical protein